MNICGEKQIAAPVEIGNGQEENILHLRDSELLFCKQVNYKIPELDSFEKVKGVERSREFQKCYARNCQSPCEVHHVLPVPQSYGPFFFKEETSIKHKGHFTSPTTYRKAS